MTRFDLYPPTTIGRESKRTRCQLNVKNENPRYFSKTSFLFLTCTLLNYNFDYITKTTLIKDVRNSARLCPYTAD